MKRVRRIVRSARWIGLLVERPALLTLFLGLLLTAVLFFAIRGEAQRRMQTEFDGLANTRIAAVQEGLNDAVGVVSTLNRAFATLRPVGRGQFTEFTRPMLEHNPQVRLIAYQRMVADAERDAFESERRRQRRTWSSSTAISRTSNASRRISTRSS